MYSSQKSKVESRKLSKMALLLIAYGLWPTALQAQCAMCRASLESSGETTQAQAVNDGIVYLMAIPYILVGIVALYIYRMYRKKNG